MAWQGGQINSFDVNFHLQKKLPKSDPNQGLQEQEKATFNNGKK